MNLKSVAFCFLFVHLVPISQSLNAVCRAYGSLCTISPINARATDQLNLILDNDIDRDSISLLQIDQPSRLYSLPAEVFEQLPSLRNVKLINVSMEILSNESLIHAKELETLNLSGNTLKVIPANIISLSTKLKYLTLTENVIYEIEDHAYNSTSLLFLNLNSNQLSTIKKNTFSNAVHLQILLLTYNHIKSIEDGAFDLPELHHLNLLGNRLKTLSADLFGKSPQLEILELSSNELIDCLEALKKAQSLKVLDLNHNPTLAGLDIMSLTHLPKLHSLIAKNTSLSINCSVPESASLTNLYISDNKQLNDAELLHHLKGLKNLQYIYLSNAGFSKLNDFDKIKELFPDLHGIYLDGNPLDCTWIENARKICVESSKLECTVDTICEANNATDETD